MKKLFLNFDVAKLARQKGFDEKCIGYFDSNGNPICADSLFNTNRNSLLMNLVAAPIHKQVTDWLKQKHKITVTASGNLLEKAIEKALKQLPDDDRYNK